MKDIFSNMNWNTKFGYGKYTFTIAEVRDLLISAAALGFIFTFGKWSLVNFFLSIAVVGPALILHELAHKFVAQKYDLVAAYVMWPTGIALALLISLITQGNMIFAAMGAVMIVPVYHTRLGYKMVGLTSAEMGKISIAGPLTNLGLAIVSYILMPFNPGFFFMSANINCWIALFNCLPVPPLDGTKIFRWNIAVWLGIFVAAIVLMYLPAFIGIFWAIIISVIIMIVLFFLIQNYVPVGQQSSGEFR
jgi:Zn-dependent protease